MPTSTDTPTVEALTAALSTPVTRELLNGGFATFAPHLQVVDERIRQSVRAVRADPHTAGVDVADHGDLTDAAGPRYGSV